MAKIQSFIHGANVDHAGNALSFVSPVDLTHTGELIDAPGDIVTRAVQDAAQAYHATRKLPVADRIGWLAKTADAIDAHAAGLVDLIIRDIGKPRRAATFEVGRAAQFLRATAAQAQTFGGESLPLDVTQAGSGRIGITRRVPYGVVAAITPFNAPINLLIQKVAPALAVGNAVVVKPHPAATRVTLMVAELFVRAGLPAGLFNVVTGDRGPAQALAGAPQVDVVTFTGGTKAGEALIRAAGARKFVAELGSNAANIVLDDADLADAATRIAAAGFEASGQQCVSAQRVIVATKVYDEFLDHFVTAASALRAGDPNDAGTDLGPMVSLAQAERVMAMARDAIARGGRYALEPRQEQCIVSPGILVDVPRSAGLWCDEVFGPLVVVERAGDVDEALRLANDSPFGLQGAVFTRDIARALRFADEFEVGSMWVNEASRFRLDTYPFGGVKQSGFGREGVRYAMEELSQLKFIGIRPVA
ncbi:aldehyde dehydrogenase family protein [Bordetella flabilis]|uniref:aldehyde dehydrogenase family protein n=1 Tax=Bordetella flabilis TaxID=463014 RepID=UPI000A0123FA|nr:aldehyde dehydrogenase family protein [Bordetella flabilis]